jgi:hypothetical protein
MQPYHIGIDKIGKVSLYPYFTTTHTHTYFFSNASKVWGCLKKRDVEET